MKAAIVYGKNDLRYEDIPVPQVGDNEVLIKVKCAGVCGSDFPRVLEGSCPKYPAILGHEFSGDVAKAGKNVKNVVIGDRVAGIPLVSCHKCIDCLKGNYAGCRNFSFIGTFMYGGWAEYVKVPDINVIKLPENVTYSEAAFLEPATVAFHALMRMGFKAGQDIAIIGMGTIGLMVLQCAGILGAKRVYVFDNDRSKLETAKCYGAYACFDTGTQGFLDEVSRMMNGRGFDYIAESAGIEYTIKLAMQLAAYKANIILVGIPSKGISFTAKEYELIDRRELNLYGSWMSYSAPFPGQEWKMAAQGFQEGRLNCDLLIDRVIYLEEVPEFFEAISVNRNIKGKIMINFK